MIDPTEFSPWDFWERADEAAQKRQLDVQREVVASRAHHSLGDGCFLSELASIDNERLVLGDRSYIAAGAYITGHLDTGADCSINPYVVVRGKVRLGDGVRIGAHSSILGFNHTMSDPDIPVFRQPLVSRGITVGDDVWIGSHVVILDGVTVGDHSVLAAGAIVTKDVPAGAVVAGNPAAFLRWRDQRDSRPGPKARVDELAERVESLAARAREQADDILARSWSSELGLFLDRPGAQPTVRAQGDAIELANLLLNTAPPQLSHADHVARLRGWQDPATGLIPSLAVEGNPSSLVDPSDADVGYHVLSIGYALDLLGSSFAHPISLVTESSAAELTRFLTTLPWDTRAWHAGHWVDAMGTALHWSRVRGDSIPDGFSEALFGWLVTNADPQSGVWGPPAAQDGLLQPVNGMYRTIRGTFAQFGLPLPYPERMIDTVLDHTRDRRFFEASRQDACNVLDVAHPLWLTMASGYRAEEVRDVAEGLLADALDRWVDGRGFAFHAPRNGVGPGLDTEPGLQGTEMWLATIWYLADLCGVSAAVGYRPRGVHRPEPAPAPKG